MYEIENWFCPVIEEEITDGLCWEYCFVTIGGPADTAYKLSKWIKETKKFKDISEFHQVCENCPHCQWAR